MNLERLRAVQVEEREADSLRALPDSFYREVAGYIEELRERRAGAAETAGDPFGSEEVRRLTDEIETAEEVAEAIYERRVGKLVKRASLAAAGMPADEEGLTSEEAALFSDLVAQIEAHRDEVLATFDGDRGAGGGDGGTASDEPVEEAARREPDGETGATLGAGTAMGSASDETAGGEGSPDPEAPSPPPDDPVTDDGTSGEAVSDSGEPRDDGSGDGRPDGPDSGPEESTDGGEAAGDTERVTLRITRDVGEVFGVDERVYDLASEDVVTLPTANAKPLLDRDAAEKID